MEDRRMDRQRTQLPARVTVTQEDRRRKDSENRVQNPAVVSMGRPMLVVRYTKEPRSSVAPACGSCSAIIPAGTVSLGTSSTPPSW